MRVGILGSGLMGGKLGTIFARAGHEVVFSYARSAAKLARLARTAGHGATAGSPQEAARDADAVLVAVHWSRVDDLLAQAGAALHGRTVITCTLPMNAADTELVVAHTSSGAEALQRRLPAGRVVSAFGTVPSEVLFDVYAGRRRARRPALVFCGDHRGAKTRTAELIDAAGFEPVDAGPLRAARFFEPFALLVARLAYEGKGGPRLAYRFERFAT